MNILCATPTPVTYIPALMRKAPAMSAGRSNKSHRTRVGHYLLLLALWLMLVGLGFAANHFAQEGADSADFAYVLFTASVAVALLDQLWRLKS